MGKYHVDTANVLTEFSRLLAEQARPNEAETLARAALEILDAVGYNRETTNYVYALSSLAVAIFQQRRYAEVKQVYLDIDTATRSWGKERNLLYRAWASAWLRRFC